MIRSLQPRIVTKLPNQCKYEQFCTFGFYPKLRQTFQNQKRAPKILAEYPLHVIAVVTSFKCKLQTLVVQRQPVKLQLTISHIFADSQTDNQQQNEEGCVPYGNIGKCCELNMDHFMYHLRIEVMIYGSLYSSVYIYLMCVMWEHNICQIPT